MNTEIVLFKFFLIRMFKGSSGKGLHRAPTCYSFLFHTLFFLLLNKKQQLGNWGNKRNPLCKLISICIMSYARNMQMNRIIYERLRLSHSVPITYKECFSSSSLLSKLARHAPHSQTRPTLNKHTHKKGLLAGYYDWVGKTCLADWWGIRRQGRGGNGWYGRNV